MPIRIVVGLVLLIALSGNLLAQDEMADQLEAARVLAEEGRLEEAITRLQHSIGKWPDDAVGTPRAHLLIARILIESNHPEAAGRKLQAIGELYGNSEQVMKEAAALRRMLQDRLERLKTAELRERAMAAELEALERKLKDQGLYGQELEEAFRREKQGIEARRRYEEDRTRYERVRKLWEEQGVSPELIRERAEKIAAERARLAEQQAELESITRALAAEGASRAAIERAIEERLRAEADEGEWRFIHDEEMQELRREFIHLAEKLGIPGDEAERLIEAHQKERGRLDSFAEKEREAERRVAKRLAEMESRFEEMTMHLERFAQHLEMRSAEFERTVLHLVKRVEELQGEVERMKGERDGE